MSASTASNTVVTQLVETLRALVGSHPGFRAAHAKGIVCAGTFRPSADARRMTRAAHLQGGTVPTIVRFSNSSGNPEAPDGQPSVRAMSVKFQLADGKAADILANSIDGFVARTPEEFLEFLRANLPDLATGKPAPDGVPKFLGSHPGAAPPARRAGPPGDHAHLADERRGRAAPGLRPHQPDRRHRALERSGPARPVGSLRELLRAAQPRTVS